MCLFMQVPAVVELILCICTTVTEIQLKSIICNSLSSVQSLWVSAWLLMHVLLVSVPLKFLISPLDCRIPSLVLLSIIHENAVMKKRERKKKNKIACWFVTINHHVVLNSMHTESCHIIETIILQLYMWIQYTCWICLFSFVCKKKKKNVCI